MRLTRPRLQADLLQAYLDASRGKCAKPYVQRFEKDLESNLSGLCDELLDRRYELRPSSCFVISDPKLREVFASDFRDRVVHHLYYNYTHLLFERTFIEDSYSCIEGRGIHYGVDRLRGHILRESQNYREECHVLKMDIRGYFMHVSRNTLHDIVLSTLRRMASHVADGIYQVTSSPGRRLR